MSVKSFLLKLLPGALFLLIWELYVHDSDRLKFLFAAPSLIAQTGLAELQQVDIWKDCGITLLEALLGLFFGTLLGTVSGLLLWANRSVDAIARPYIILIGSVPVFALAPVMIIWFGIGLLSKAVMAGFAVYFVSILQAYEGAHVIAAQYLNYARSLRAPRFRAIFKIIVPGSIHWVLTGFRMNVGFALTGAFIGEFVSSEAGIGHYILKASSLYDMPRVFLGLLLISMMAMALTGLASVIQRSYRLGI